MSAGRVRYDVWALRVVTWDALIPVCVIILPLVAKLLVPDRREVLEFAAVFVPLAAFLLRLGAGGRHILSNRCSRRFQRLQMAVFCLGIVPLVLVDCVIILSEVMPAGALAEADYIVLATLIMVYLASMTLSMYPGRDDVPANDWTHDALADADGNPDVRVPHAVSMRYDLSTRSDRTTQADSAVGEALESSSNPRKMLIYGD